MKYLMKHPDISKLKPAANESATREQLQCTARWFGLIWLAVAVVFWLATATGFASGITWGAPALISGDADVTNTGSVLYAYAGGATTVNGVAFAAGGNGTVWGSVSFTSFGGFNSVFGSAVAPFGSLSAAYKTALSTAAWGSGTAGTVTLNGLIPGHAYTVQIWVDDSRGSYQYRYEAVTSTGGNTVTLDFAPNSNSAGAVGQYVVGTFIASATSQAFSINGNAVVQLNAISVRDNGFIPPAFSPLRVNLAKHQPVITDSTTGTQGGQYLTDGLTVNDSYWQSGASGAHWAQVVFPFPVPVGSAQLAMGRDNVAPPTVFWLQYLTNSTWVNVPGTILVGNTNKEVNLIFTTPVTASSFRFYDSIDGNIYLREMALYPPNGTNGFPFGTDFAVDLARKQPVFATANSAGNYPLLAVDGQVNPASAWQTTLVGSNSLLVNLQFTNKLGSAHLYSGATGVAPLTNFSLQYWDGGTWQNIPGGSVADNTNSSLVIPFTTPVTTTKVQLLFTNARVSAVQELCLFSANSNGGYPLGAGVTTNPPVTVNYDTYSDSYYYLSNSAAGMAVVESNGVPALGQSGRTNYPGQYQVVLNFDNGTYRLRNRATGLCLAGSQLTTNVGVTLVDEPYTALPDQEWFLQPVDGTNYYLVNQFSGLVVDTLSSGATAGTTLVQARMTNSPSQYWQFPLATIFPKKGSGGPAYAVIQNASWCYTWWVNTGTPLPTNIVFYPMDNSAWFMGHSLAGNLLAFNQTWRTNGQSQFLMGYNEPDQATQGNLDATNGAIYWHNFCNFNMPLAGPAPASLFDGWLSTFMGYVVTNWGLRVDYLPAHEYPGNNSGASSGIWINTLQSAYNTWGKPVWMTEFGCVDWAGNQSWTEENNYNALAEFLWRAESLPWLRKYAIFSFGGPLAPNPWTPTTPAPTSNCFDTNRVLTPLGELYGAWDGDANVETNKAYYLHNNGTSKRLANTLAPQLPDAKSILVRDDSVQWSLAPASTPGLYYLVSGLDGRRLSYVSDGLLSLATPGTPGTAVQWSLTPYQYGWYYLDHPVTGKRLSLAYNNSTFTATYSLVTNSTTGTAVQWRFIVPYTPVRIVWLGGINAAWAAPGNWDTTTANPSVNQGGNYAVTFNNLSATNLATVLNYANNPSISNGFTVYGITVNDPAGAVSIGGTNTLVIGNDIDLSGASQDLTISTPVFMGVSQPGTQQFWTVTNTRTLSVNGSVAGWANLIVAGGGTVSLGGTNTYTGSTTISNNTLLTISGAGELGGGAYPSAVTDNGAFNYNSSASQTLSGNISGSGSVTVNGTGSLTLSGTNNYTGNTAVIGGTLALSGSGSLASPNIIVAGGAMFNVSGLATPFALTGGSTLTNCSVGAVINGNMNCSVGTLSLVNDGVNPSFLLTNGTMTVSAGAVVKINNTGKILGVGKHPIIAAVVAGNVGKVSGILPVVMVAGNGAAGAVSLQTNRAGGLDLLVTSTTASTTPNINLSLAKNTLKLTWPGDHLGWIAQSNVLDLANSNYWFDILGSQLATNLVIPVNPVAPKVFYRLRYPY